MTPLEKRAVVGLIIGVVWAIAFFGVFVVLGGVSAFLEDEVMRGIMLAIVVAGGIACVILSISYVKSGLVDERDKLILIWAAATQAPAIIVVVGVFAAALGLIYAFYVREHVVSIVYLYLMVIAMVMVNMLALAIGILFWSRRTEHLKE